MNLRPAPWEDNPKTVAELKSFINHNREFTAIGVGYYGQTTTAKELKEHGITHAQILYGKNLDKAWYGEL